MPPALIPFYFSMPRLSSFTISQNGCDESFLWSDPPHALAYDLCKLLLCDLSTPPVA